MNYEAAVAWLYATQLHGIRLGLDNVRRMIDARGVRLDRPKFLHVAGTNGKGSVCAMLDAVCRAAGHRTGLFTSPHLVTFRERIRVDGQMIPEDAVARRLGDLRDLTAGWDYPTTFFELTTVLALEHFQEMGCEVVVLETGMGGRLDATNVVTPAVSVITSIALDHQQWLGNTIGEIAAEKAGIFKPDVPAVSARQSPEAAEVLRRHAREVGVLTLDFVTEPWKATPINLPGAYQSWNAALAVRALALSGLPVPSDAPARGLRQVEWPGRFQRCGEKLILDGAHNPAAALLLVETWRETFGAEKATLILGVLADKDLRSICSALLPLAARVIAVPVRSPRTVPPAEIRTLLQELDPELLCTLADSAPAALAAAATFPERTLLCGSLFLVGETLAHLESNASPVETSAQ